MGHNSLDPTRGYPEYSSTGAPSEAADLTEVSAWAAANIDRVVASQAALSTSFTYLYTGLCTRVSAIPGAFFQYNGSGWDMVGRPYFASAAALAAAITSPVVGMEIFRTDLQMYYRYHAAYNSSTNPNSPLLAAGWCPVTPSGRFRGVITAAKTVTAGAKWGISSGPTFDSTDDPDSGFSTSTGFFTVQKGGTYLILISGKQSTSTSSSLSVLINGTPAMTSPNMPTTAFSGIELVSVRRLNPGDTVAGESSGTYTSQSDSASDNNFFELLQTGW